MNEPSFIFYLELSLIILSNNVLIPKWVQCKETEQTLEKV